MSDDKDTGVKTWDLPHIDMNLQQQDADSTDVFNRPRGWKYEPPEEEIEIQPPTAEEIEAIRAAAQADGFAQGQQEGHTLGLEQGKKEGYEQGLAQGKNEGHEQGLAASKEEVSQHIDALIQLLEKLQKPVDSVEKNLEKELVQLAVSLARAVIRSELKTNKDMIFQAISEGLKVLPIQESRYQIHLNPDDISLVKSHFSSEEMEKHKWNLVESPHISRGGCEIITDSNAVDITVERRVRDVLDRFLLEQGLNTVNDAESNEL